MTQAAAKRDEGDVAQVEHVEFLELHRSAPPSGARTSSGALSRSSGRTPWSSGRTLALDAARRRSIPGLGHY